MITLFSFSIDVYPMCERNWKQGLKLKSSNSNSRHFVSKTKWRLFKLLDNEEPLLKLLDYRIASLFPIRVFTHCLF